MRLFFGIEIPRQTKRAIDEWRSAAFGISSPVVPAENLHITLAFLGEVEESKIEQLHEIAQHVSKQSFKVELDSVGCFVKPRILWLGFSKKNRELEVLAVNLQTQLAREGFHIDRRKYEPHVTLWRKLPAECLQCRPTVDPDFSFGVDYFTLFESKQLQARSRRDGKGRDAPRPAGSRVIYRALEDYPLIPQISQLSGF